MSSSLHYNFPPPAYYFPKEALLNLNLSVCCNTSCYQECMDWELLILFLFKGARQPAFRERMQQDEMHSFI